MKGLKELGLKEERIKGGDEPWQGEKVIPLTNILLQLITATPCNSHSLILVILVASDPFILIILDILVEL